MDYFFLDDNKEIFSKIHLQWMVYDGLQYCGNLALVTSLEKLWRKPVFTSSLNHQLVYVNLFEDYPLSALSWISFIFVHCAHLFAQVFYFFNITSSTLVSLKEIFCTVPPCSLPSTMQSNFFLYLWLVSF